jgi:DNA-binding response OmpR family regulator
MCKYKTILVVDDEPEILDLLGEFIKEGCKDTVVITCPNPDRAVDIAAAMKFDLMLIDYHCGIMNGFQLQHRLFQMGQNCPTIFITGDDVASKKLSERHEVITKPFSFDHLTETVRKKVA